MPATMRLALFLVASLVLVLADLLPTLAGETVRGPVRVCRKPMLAGHASMAALVNPGPDAWRQLAERQAEEAKHCYIAGDIELVEKGPEIAFGPTKCTEWEATANGDPVFVVIGSSRRWGHCP